MKTETIDVQGMSCNHCVVTVEEALKNLEGVKSAAVSLENANVVVEYDELVVTLETLRTEIEDVGYGIR